MTRVDRPCNPLLDLDRAHCFRLSAPQVETVRFVIANSAPEERIFVGNGINDKTFENDNSLYFLSGRLPATKWSQYDPGLQNSQAIQAEMVEDLERNKPPLVILDTEFDNYKENNAGTNHSGVTLLDDYIHNNYRKVAEYGPYLVLQR